MTAFIIIAAIIVVLVACYLALVYWPVLKFKIWLWAFRKMTVASAFTRGKKDK